jgi:hypothetical protein
MIVIQLEKQQKPIDNVGSCFERNIIPDSLNSPTTFTFTPLVLPELNEQTNPKITIPQHFE